VTLHATYTFPVAVPSGLSELAGGRREGVLAGRVEGAGGLTDLVVLIGPYRVRVGADGSFHARLRPGEYHVRLDPRSVPVTYVIEQPAEATVHVAAKATTHVALALAKGAGVSGHVLLDTNGDGTPDSPRHGVVATIALLDAAGALHSTSTDAEGVFLFRNVTPGAASLTISGLPLGDAAENGPHRSVDVTAGTTSQVDILIHPVASNAKVFGGSTLRIRSVHLEADRAPPGSAPLVDVVTSAPADGVTLVTSAGSVALSGSGTHWRGRVPIPKSASAGVYIFKISARTGTKAEERRGQLIVDPGVPLLTAAIDKKGAPGGTLTVNATLLTEATHVEVTGANSIGVAGGLKSMGQGAWSADLPVPEGLAPGRYTLTITAYGRGGVLGSTTATAVIAP